MTAALFNCPAYIQSNPEISFLSFPITPFAPNFLIIQFTMRFQSLSFLSYFLASVYAHSIITDPPPRAIGKSSLSACGQDITSLLEKDNQTSIDTLQIAAATSQGFNATECDLRLCKGLKLDDNLHNVQNWVEGQEVTIKVWERIPHMGWVSVAIIDTKTKFIVGEDLLTFETTSGKSKQQINIFLSRVHL